MQISVMGKKYKVIIKADTVDDVVASEGDTGAYCDVNNRLIVLFRKVEGIVISKILMQRYLCHELSHAYMYEMGSRDWDNEDIVEMIGTIISGIIECNMKEFTKIVGE